MHGASHHLTPTPLHPNRTYRLPTTLPARGYSFTLVPTHPPWLQVVIATHGRLKDWVSKRLLNLRTVKILVFDEADEMLKVRAGMGVSDGLEVGLCMAGLAGVPCMRSTGLTGSFFGLHSAPSSGGCGIHPLRAFVHAKLHSGQ